MSFVRNSETLLSNEVQTTSPSQADINWSCILESKQIQKEKKKANTVATPPSKSSLVHLPRDKQTSRIGPTSIETSSFQLLLELTLNRSGPSVSPRLVHMVAARGSRDIGGVTVLGRVAHGLRVLCPVGVCWGGERHWHPRRHL